MKPGQRKEAHFSLTVSNSFHSNRSKQANVSMTLQKTKQPLLLKALNDINIPLNPPCLPPLSLKTNLFLVDCKEIHIINIRCRITILLKSFLLVYLINQVTTVPQDGISYKCRDILDILIE